MVKVNNKLMEIKGIRIPDLSEPIGDQFKHEMNEIHSKIEKKRVEMSNLQGEIKRLKNELIKEKNNLLMCDDEFEEFTLRNKCKDLEQELSTTKDYSHFSIKEYSSKLINTEYIQDLKEKAAEEHIEIAKDIEAYRKVLEDQYSKSIKKMDGFMTSYRSDSSYREGSSRYNSYK